VLQHAVFHVQSAGRKKVTGANVLVAICGERKSKAVYLLNKQNITRLDLVNYISDPGRAPGRGLTLPPNPAAPAPPLRANARRQREQLPSQASQAAASWRVTRGVGVSGFCEVAAARLQA
jgi:ATP-dependent Clp protease ATP-binding subunit ClpA